MVNYKNKEEIMRSNNKGEIIFANHKLEFYRFFEAHKKLCDQISGLKYHTINNIHNEQKIVITHENFSIGINRLNAFITDYRHYITDELQLKQILTRFQELEEEYNNDEEYQQLVKRKGNMSINQEIRLNTLYLKYLINCFEIAHLTSKYLQKSLNIASKEINKNIHFVDYDGFFNELSKYRDETVQDLSNLKYETIFDNYKKLLGYVYTYGYLMTIDSFELVKETMKTLYEYITEPNTMRFIIKIREGGEITNTQKDIMKQEFKIVRRTFNNVYVLCNSSLKNKNILPKTKIEITYDRTLI